MAIRLGRHAVRCALLLFTLLPATGGLAALDRIVAIVNGDVILESALRSEYQRIAADLAAQGTTPPSAEVLLKQVLDHLIMESLQLQLASQSGIRVGDEELNFTLQNIAERNGVTLEQMRDSLATEGIALAQFREQVRKEMIITRLRQRDVVMRIDVSDREIDNLLNQEALHGGSQRYQVGHILIALADGATAAETAAANDKMAMLQEQLAQGADFASLAVANSDGQNALSGGDLGWRNLGELPTLFADALRNMAPGEVSDVLRSPGGLHLIQLRDRQGDEQHIVRQQRLRHILINVDEGVDENIARQRLEQLRQRIEAGEDFAELARAHSEDPASAVKGGDLGWVSPGQMVARFETAANALAPMELSAPVRTEYGWHLIQSQEEREEDQTTAYRRQRAVAQIRARKADEKLSNWLRRMRDEAYVEIRI